jgi:GDPmannose 4,6-dehydratase
LFQNNWQLKIALIIGHTGQDGTYLKKFLLQKGYFVVGLSSKEIFSNLKCHLDFGNIADSIYVNALIKKVVPDEIYYLAAVHQSSVDKKLDDFDLFQKSFSTNTLSLLNVLNAIRNQQPKCRLFYAASSHIFGNTSTEIQDEQTVINPNCIYGITKTAGIDLCHFYKNNHNIFTSIGIFYNHESPLRSSKFVSKKIVETAVAIKSNKQHELILGDLSATIDWGYAPDYVEAAYQILQADKADDFIIATGEVHTVKDFVEQVFYQLGLDWTKYVREDSSIITKQNKRKLLGNYSKLHKTTGWKPSVSFNQMIKILVDAELQNQLNSV